MQKPTIINPGERYRRASPTKLNPSGYIHIAPR
jgi:hypothetical protein